MNSGSKQKNQEYTLSLSNVIQSFLSEHPEIDPFTLSFDPAEFVEKVAAYARQPQFSTYKIKDAGEIRAILILHHFYLQLVADIEDLLEQINLATNDVLLALLQLSNVESIGIMHDSIEKMKQEGKRRVPQELNESNTITLPNIFGDEVKVQQANDVLIEVFNELTQIILDYRPEHDPKAVVLSQEQRITALKKCSITANCLFNLKEAFAFFRHEFSELKMKDSEIHFQHEPAVYYLLRNAGRERFSNHIFESQTMLSRTFRPHSRVSSYQVIRGKLSFALTGEERFNALVLSNVGLKEAYFGYLEGYKIKALDNLTVTEILLVLGELQNLFYTLDAWALSRKIADTQDENLIPIYIPRQELIRHLYKLTHIKETTIQKVLSLLTTSLTEGLDIWKTPLLTIGPNYYFVHGAITHFNPVYAMERILEKTTDHTKRLAAFTRYVKEHILLDKKGVPLPSLETDAGRLPSEALQNALIYELSTIYIIIQPCLIGYPFTSMEYHRAMQVIHEKAEMLKAQTGQLRDYLGGNVAKKIIRVVLPNYPSLSGLVVNDCFVMDGFLLRNYFGVGHFAKGVAITGNGSMGYRKVSSIDYYTNDVEMSNQFIPFCINPEPIRQILLHTEVARYPLLPDSHPRFYRDGVKDIPLVDLLWAQVKDIEYCLRQLYYFESALEKNAEGKKLLQEKIEFLLPQVLSSIAIYSKDREARIQVLEMFKRIGQPGLIYLIYSFQQSIGKLSSRPFLKKKPAKLGPADATIAQKDIAQLLKQSLPHQPQIRLTEFKLQHQLSEAETLNALSYLLDLLSIIGQQSYTDEELENFTLPMILFAALVNEHKEYEHYLYPVFLNFIDALNYNFQYQKAKNFAEEVLIYSFEHQPLPLMGWLCLFKCFLKQKNVYDAAYYGSLFVYCVNFYPDADEELVSQTLYNAMLFFRDYHFPDVEEALYQSLQQLQLSDYDRQKITLTYFGARLQEKGLETNNETLQLVEAYLTEHLESICQFGDKGAMPWVSLLYNFRNLKNIGMLAASTANIETAISRFEAELTAEQLQTIQARFFAVPAQTKRLYKEALLRLFDSAFFDDVAHELETLEPIAKNVALLSLEPIDLDALLLTGFAFNDQSLTFPTRDITEEVAPFTTGANEEMDARIETYKSYVFSKLQLQEGQVLVWLFDIYEKVYCLQIDWKHNSQVIVLDDWSLRAMDNWMQKIKQFSFDDKGGQYFIDLQEQDYQRSLKELEFAVLPAASDVRELFLFASLRLATFPHNLMSISLDHLPPSDVHSEYVRHFFAAANRDFISLYKPLTNVISLEWFLDNHSEIVLNQKDFSMESWIPVDEGDKALEIGYYKLRPLLEEEYNCQIITSLVPDITFHSSINIFMAHGGKGSEGFKTMYTRNEDGYAFVKEKGLDQILGSGTIAVLFVCHSASISPQAFSQRLVSLSHSILAKGYKAVIAPSWALHPVIPATWLKAFLSHLKQGIRLSECVFYANQTTAKEGFDAYSGYYAPNGWAAMHLYGNPNIRFISS